MEGEPGDDNSGIVLAGDGEVDLIGDGSSWMGDGDSGMVMAGNGDGLTVVGDGSHEMVLA